MLQMPGIKVLLKGILVPVPDGANQDDDEDEELEALTSFPRQFFQNRSDKPCPEDELPQLGLQDDPEDGGDEEEESEDCERHCHRPGVLLVRQSQAGDGDDEDEQGEAELHHLVEPPVPVESQDQEVRQEHHVGHHSQDVKDAGHLISLVFGSGVGFRCEKIE